jgi:hypothetical protein
MRATDKRIELLPPQLNAREIRLDGVFTRDSHASPRTTMIYNNPRREEIVRQMSATNPSKILAIAPSKAWERRIRTRVDETFQWNLVGESPTWAKP